MRPNPRRLGGILNGTKAGGCNAFHFAVEATATGTNAVVPGAKPVRHSGALCSPALWPRNGIRNWIFQLDSPLPIHARWPLFSGCCGLRLRTERAICTTLRAFRKCPSGMNTGCRIVAARLPQSANSRRPPATASEPRINTFVGRHVVIAYAHTPARVSDTSRLHPYAEPS